MRGERKGEADKVITVSGSILLSVGFAVSFLNLALGVATASSLAQGSGHTPPPPLAYNGLGYIGKRIQR